MMKKTISALVLFSIISLASRAQEVKPIEASIEDYIALLNQNGYQAYSFDISPMKDATYQVQFEVREYVAHHSIHIYEITSNIVKPVFIPTTYLNFSDDPAFRKLSRCSGRPF